MRRITVLALIFVFATAGAALLLPALGPRAQAQQPCTEFRAIGQSTLPTPHRMSPEDTWGGDVYGTLGGQEFLFGYFSGNDGTGADHGTIGSARNGSYTFVFGSDTFTIEVPHAVFPFPPGKGGLGYYKGEAKIVQGTGRFQNASGNIDWAGPFIVWTPDGVNFYGRYNAEIRGSICGVQ